MIGNILDNTTELWMTIYIIGEIFSSGGATLYKNPSNQTVFPQGIFLNQNCYEVLVMGVGVVYIFQF